MSGASTRMGHYDAVDKKMYFEVADPRSGRVRMETLSLDEAKVFVRGVWDKSGEVLEIHEIRREDA